MDKKIDIHKAAGVLLQNGKILITRTRDKDFFIAPGGKVEYGETVMQALERELEEELGIQINESDLEEFGTFFALAAGYDDKYLQMDVFIVQEWDGEITPQAEIEEVMWISSEIPAIELGSIFKHDVLPKLKSKGLID